MDIFTTGSASGTLASGTYQKIASADVSLQDVKVVVDVTYNGFKVASFVFTSLVINTGANHIQGSMIFSEGNQLYFAMMRIGSDDSYTITLQPITL